jgi:hypothetical protein
MRAASASGAVILASSLWLADALAQAPLPPPPPPPVAPVVAPAAATAPAPVPATATATAPATPTPTPTATAAPAPAWNGKTADLLSPTFGSPHPPVIPGGSQRTWGIVSGVFGAIFIGTGFGWSAFAKSTYDNANKPGFCVNDVCTAQGLVDRANARTIADIATASFVGGTLLVGTGVLLFLTAASPNEPPGTALQVSPGGVRLRGSW